MTNVLCIDPSTKTGICTRIDGVVDHYTLNLKDGGEDYAEMGWYFLNHLKHLMAYDQIDVMVIERPGRLFGAAACILNGIVWQAHMIAHDFKMQRHEVTPSQLKKFTTGKGNCNKAAMIAAVEAMGYEPEDDNSADAIAILKYYEGNIEV